MGSPTRPYTACLFVREGYVSKVGNVYLSVEDTVRVPEPIPPSTYTVREKPLIVYLEKNKQPL